MHLFLVSEKFKGRQNSPQLFSIVQWLSEVKMLRTEFTGPELLLKVIPQAPFNL